MRNVGSGIADIAIHLAHDADVLVAVEQRILVLALDTAEPASGAAAGCLERLKAGIGEHNDQSLRVVVRGRHGRVLFRNQLRQRWRR